MHGSPTPLDRRTRPFPPSPLRSSLAPPLFLASWAWRGWHGIARRAPSSSNGRARGTSVDENVRLKAHLTTCPICRSPYAPRGLDLEAVRSAGPLAKLPAPPATQPAARP